MMHSSFGEMAQANFGLKKVVEALTYHFEHEVPDGFPVASSWFIERYAVEVNVHVHGDYGTAPAPTSWTNNLCFLPSVDVLNGDTNMHRVTEEENDPVAVFKGIIKRSKKDSSLHFQNIFVVKRTESSNYHINIHKYPRSFFHMIVLDDPQLLGHVVQKRIRINGTQLELPRETLLSEFVD